MVKIGYMKSFFGCCQLRTAVMFIAMLDVLLGIYEIMDFTIKMIMNKNLHGHVHTANETIHMRHLNFTINSTSIHHTNDQKRHYYFQAASIAAIIIGTADLVISLLLLYAASFKRYKLQIIVFTAAVWGMLMGCLNMMTFAFSVATNAVSEIIIFLLWSLLEFFFAYVILSYYNFVNLIIERGMDGTNMAYFAEDNFTEVQMEEPDEQPIMDDQDDFPTDDRKNIYT